MTKITDKRISNDCARTGDWVWVDNELCVIAKTGIDQVRLIAISESDANRYSDSGCIQHPNDGKLTAEDMKKITASQPWRKVKVEIFITD